MFAESNKKCKMTLPTVAYCMINLRSPQNRRNYLPLFVYPRLFHKPPTVVIGVIKCALESVLMNV